MAPQLEAPGAALDDILRTGPFDRALHLAIQARGLSLERIHARLRSQGVHVSVASLSYWQRGRYRPERRQSLRAVRALEGILGLPADSLIMLLGPRRPSLTYNDICSVPTSLNELLGDMRDPADDQLETLSHHECVTVGPHHEEQSAHSRIVFKARRAGVDRYVAIYHCEDGPPPDGFSSELCRVGRMRVDAEYGLMAVELLFDHPLAEGETYVVEYEFFFRTGGPRVSRYVRGFRFPAREYLLQVRFGGAAVPERCYRIWQPTIATAAATEQPEVRLNKWNSAHLVVLGLRPGVHGIRWEWPPG